MMPMRLKQNIFKCVPYLLVLFLWRFQPRSCVSVRRSQVTPTFVLVGISFEIIAIVFGLSVVWRSTSCCCVKVPFPWLRSVSVVTFMVPIPLHADQSIFKCLKKDDITIYNMQRTVMLLFRLSALRKKALNPR